MRDIKKLGPTDTEALKRFFAIIRADADSVKKFHPHPLDDKTAEQISMYAGKDYYAATFEDGEIIAYGMLRGWDEGYEKPSLGVIVKPELRGKGIGTEMIQHLIKIARERKSPAIILKVYKWNPARHLYERLGFVMEDFDEEQLRGTLEL